MTTVAKTNGQAVQAPSTVKGLLGSDNIKSRFQEILKDKAPGFISSVLNIVNGSTNLQMADPQSVIMAAAVAATLDLPINPNLGFAYIIPYQQSVQENGQWKSKQVAQFQMGYKGFIQLAKRSGQYLKINAMEVRAGQLKKANHLTEEYEFDFSTHADEVVGFVVYFKELNGFEKTIYWNVARMNEHAKRYSKSYGKKTSPWTTNYMEMGCKTLLKLALSKYGTLSIEMQKAFSADQAVVHDMNGEKFEYVDHADITGQQSIGEPGTEDQQDLNAASSADQSASTDNNPAAESNGSQNPASTVNPADL